MFKYIFYISAFRPTCCKLKNKKPATRKKQNPPAFLYLFIFPSFTGSEANNFLFFNFLFKRANLRILSAEKF